MTEKMRACLMGLDQQERIDLLCKFIESQDLVEDFAEFDPDTPDEEDVDNEDDDDSWIDRDLEEMGINEKYTRKHYRQFCKDMINGGMGDNLRHYQGRFFYKGPACDCDDIGEVLQKTKVPCNWDQLGLGYIVYPKG